MKFVNRGYIVVQPTKEFIEWANKNDEDYADLTDNEPSVYLIDEDFFDDEEMIQAKFKKIFRNELAAVTSNDEVHPEITRENFDLYFTCSLGSTVFDLCKEDLKAD